MTISIIPVVGVTGDTHGIESEESDSDEGKDKIKVRFYRYGTDEDMNSPTPLVVRYTMMSESLYGPALGFNGGNSLDRAQKEDFDQASQSFFNLVGTEVRDGYTYDIYEVSFGMNVSYVDFDLTPIADGDADRGMEGFNVSVVPDDDHKYVVAGSIDGNEWDITVKGTEPRSNVDVYVLDGVTAFVRGSDDGLPPGSANLGINRTDVLQYGRLDCWFMAALLAAANDEWALLQSHVQPLANGQYNVQLYNEQTNAWEGFTVDAKLSDNLMMAQVADFDTEVGSATYGKSEVWPLLFERAMDRLLDRQRLNNPETPTTNTGAWSGIGWVALTGGDAHNIRMEPEVVGGPTTEQQVRNAIAQLRNEGYTQVLLTSDKAIVDPQDPDNRLLVPGHEVVVDLNESNENGLATMNPFGEVYDRFVPYDLIVSRTVIGVTGVRTPFSP